MGQHTHFPGDSLAPPNHDRTRQVVINNLARLKLIAVAGSVFCDSDQHDRLLRLLLNRRDWGLPPPLIMAAVHRDVEEVMAARFSSGAAGELARFRTVHQSDHAETVGNAVRVYRELIDPAADIFTAKRHSLFLTRRGGRSRATFVSPFTGGGGTTCGAWTHKVATKPDGSPIKGFMKAALVVGFCPVECPACYLQSMFTDAMDVALNWQDLADELREEWQGFALPINFGETSGLIEYDEWFAREGGEGSMAQHVIDSCAAADVTPFFLTKIRYPRYLQFRGKVQVGVSLMPEQVRQWWAPHGSPTDELLDGLAWAIQAGARDPVVRMAVIWSARELYPELLRQCRDRLGKTGWRLTADIMRFTPRTALTIAERYPEASRLLAEEIAPGIGLGLDELAHAGIRERAKKIRPPEQRQAEIYTAIRDELNGLGCEGVLLTPCKGDPDELLPLVRSKVLSAMPCACYGASRPGDKPPDVELQTLAVRKAVQP